MNFYDFYLWKMIILILKKWLRKSWKYNVKEYFENFVGVFA